MLPSLVDQGNSDPVRVVIIGGGITGLSAAFYLERAARAAGQVLHCIVVERDTRLGGKILTDTIEQDGHFIVEGGPDSFVSQKPWAIELARDLGLSDQLHGTHPAKQATYVLSGGRPCPMPEGTMLIVPTRLGPFLRTPLISPLGKLRMALELVLPARKDDRDETLADFMRRRLGNEALDKLGEPLLSGIHSAECERQSLMATFPRFRDMERSHGSVIRAMRAARRAATKAGPETSARTAASPFMTLKGGIGTLVDALVAQVSATILTGRAVTGLAHDPVAEHPYRLLLDDRTRLEADAVVVTTPAFAAKALLEPRYPELAQTLGQIRYVSSATISLAYRKSEIGTPLDGYGVVIPRSERRKINAITVTSAKFAGRAPDEYVMLRVFVGGSRTPEALALDDTGLETLVRSELQSILGIGAAPVFTRIYRWANSNPQYDLGHLERVAAIERLCPEGLYLAGSAYNGVGIPDCVRQGKQAAERVLKQLKLAVSV